MKIDKLWTILLVCLLMAQIAAAEAENSPAVEVKEKDSNYKYYFSTTEFSTWFGLVVMSLMMVLCTLGGIGGNIVILPVCLVFFQFDPHVAVGHTTFFSSISSLVRVGVEIFKKTKTKNLNFDAALMSLTPCIVGSVVGVFLNKMCPNVLILTLATVLLFSLMIKAIRDFKKMSAQEEQKGRKLMRTKSELIELDHVHHHHQDDNGDDEDDAKPTNREQLVPQESKEEEFDPTPQSALHDQYKISQKDILFYMLIFCFPLSFSLLRGTQQRPSIIGIERCGKADLTLVVMYIGALVFLTMHLKKIIQTRNKFVKENVCNIDFRKDEATNKFLFTMTAVGFVGTFLSAGYSVLLNISLMMLELTPFAASATALFIGVIFSLASSLVFYFEDLLYLNCAVIGGVVIAVATLTVRLTLYERFVRLGKGSYTLFFMAIMLGMGIISTLLVVGPKIKATYDAGENIWAFTSIC